MTTTIEREIWVCFLTWFHTMNTTIIFVSFSQTPSRCFRTPCLLQWRSKFFFHELKLRIRLILYKKYGIKWMLKRNSKYVRQELWLCISPGRSFRRPSVGWRRPVVSRGGRGLSAIVCASRSVQAARSRAHPLRKGSSSFVFTWVYKPVILNLFYYREFVRASTPPCIYE